MVLGRFSLFYGCVHIIPANSHGQECRTRYFRKFVFFPIRKLFRGFFMIYAAKPMRPCPAPGTEIPSFDCAGECASPQNAIFEKSRNFQNWNDVRRSFSKQRGGMSIEKRRFPMSLILFLTSYSLGTTAFRSILAVWWAGYRLSAAAEELCQNFAY